MVAVEPSVSTFQSAGFSISAVSLTMHQHPRSPATLAPARADSSRPDDLRERDDGANSPAVDPRTNPGRGLGIATESSEQPQRNAAPAKESISKLNQIISVRF